MLLKYLNNLHYNDVGTRKKHLFYNVTEFICQQDKCCEHKQGYIKGTVYLFVYQSTTSDVNRCIIHAQQWLNSRVLPGQEFKIDSFTCKFYIYFLFIRASLY